MPMKKISRLAAVAAVLGLGICFSVASPVFAAFNDVTLTTSSVIVVGGVSLSVSGASGVVQSIVVSPGSFGVTMANGSALTVTALGLTTIGVTSVAGVASTFTCGSPSTLAITATGVGTVTVTPGGACTVPIVSGGGGSGSAYSPPATPASIPILINGGAATTSSVGVVLALSATNASEMMISNDANFTGANWESYAVSKNWILLTGVGTTTVYVQFRNLNGVISVASTDSIVLVNPPNAFSNAAIVTPTPLSGVVIVNINTATQGTSSSSANMIVMGAKTFEHNLKVGSKGDDVVQLQLYLEKNGFLVMPVGIKKGYFGGATQEALKKYQKSIGVQPTGSLGPKTRAALNMAVTQ